MDGFGDRPGQKLQLAIAGDELEQADIVDAVLVEATKEVLARDATAAPVESGGEENLFAAGQRIAARAASASTRGQYAGLYRRFGDWLTSELGRPATVADLDADAIAAYARHLETRGGRGGRPAALATRRVQLTMVRALARELGLEQVANDTRVPRHRAGPPEVISHVEYQNLLRVPDRRSARGKRDHALLRVLGDCGLRAAETCGLTARSLRRPRANGRHWRLYVHGKGGVEREVPVPAGALAAVEAWLAVHPLARGAGLRDDEPLFVRLGRYGELEAGALSTRSVHKLMAAAATMAGIEARLAHPHMLRAYWATTLLEDGAPVHLVSARLGHADLRTTSRYAADRTDSIDDVADLLDRRAQQARRSAYADQ